MKLPNPERAIISRQKLTTYCLNPEHPDGLHKARVFKSALGISLDEVEELQVTLLQAIQVHDAIPTKRNQHGQKYIIDFTMNRLDKQAVVRSAWIVRDTEDFPRLVTCYVL